MHELLENMLANHATRAVTFRSLHVDILAM